MRWLLTGLFVLVVAAPAAGDDRLNSMIGSATRADIVEQFGPPQQIMQVDGDEFFIYSVAVKNSPMADFAEALQRMGAAGQGRDYTPPPRPRQTVILRFDGATGRLKAWNVR